MRPPDWSKLGLNQDILTEPIREDNRIVLWRPEGEDRDFRYWERIGTIPRAEIRAEQGICTLNANLVRARERKSNGFLSKLTRKLMGASGEDSWTLPNGQSVEKCGDRRTDLLLVWPADNTSPLNEAMARIRWPELSRFEPLGEQLFLISGASTAEGSAPSTEATAGLNGAESLGNPIAQAEQFLEIARQSGDRSREAGALTDLGLVLMVHDSLDRAIEILGQAIDLSQELRDRTREMDALSSMAVALLARGESSSARQILDRALMLSRHFEDKVAEKLVLERLGMACGNLGDPNAALDFAEQALTMTRAMRDEQQEARLLWNQAIALADLHQRDQAIAKGQESIDLLRKLGKPEASAYGAQLQRYRMELSALTAPPVVVGASVPTSNDPNAGPGLLRMAVSAAQAMTKFIGSGMKTTPASIQQQRLAICESCEHHTGVRCRVCGCFTRLKTRLAHEQCPIGKWPE